MAICLAYIVCCWSYCDLFLCSIVVIKKCSCADDKDYKCIQPALPMCWNRIPVSRRWNSIQSHVKIPYIRGDVMLDLFLCNSLQGVIKKHGNGHCTYNQWISKAIVSKYGELIWILMLNPKLNWSLVLKIIPLWPHDYEWCFSASS